MTLAEFLESARKRSRLLVIIVAAGLVFAAVVYSAASDHYAVNAVVTAKSAEDRNIDATSISGLAALAGGGKRPSFEQFNYLVGSDAVIRAVLPALRRDSPKLTEELLGQSALGRFRATVENASRTVFNKDPVVLDPNERLVSAIGARLKLAKTPEGYLRMDLTANVADGQLALLNSLIQQADMMVRVRERAEYAARIATYKSMIDNQGPTAERAILVALITREYSQYVTAQAGQTFSYHFVEQPRGPKRVYSIGLLTLMVLAVAVAVVVWLAAVAAGLWWQRR